MMMTPWKGVFAGSFLLAMTLLHSQGRPPNVDWPVYGGDSGSMRYSSLKQINRTNVRQLQVTWSYDARRTAHILPGALTR